MCVRVIDKERERGGEGDIEWEGERKKEIKREGERKGEWEGAGEEC